MNSRKLKIYSRFQKSSNRLITVPEIKLRGKWLDKIGFGKGKTVHIQQKKKKLPLLLRNSTIIVTDCKSTTSCKYSF